MPKHKFKGKLDKVGPEGAWTFMKIPFDSAEAFGTKGRVSVSGTLNGHPFRSSIFPDGKGGHHMMVNKQMQAGAKVKPGGAVAVVMERDDAPREVSLPRELASALRKASLMKAWNALSPSCRKEHADYVSEAKQAETRARRVAKCLPLIAAKKRVKM